MSDETTKDEVVQISEVEDLTGRHRATIFRDYKAGRFPAPFFVGERRAWYRRVVLAWVAQQAARPASERRLARNLNPSVTAG